MVRIDADTGLLPTPESATTIVEAFKPGTEPMSARPAAAVAGLDGGGAFDADLY